jgi:hypothetical protein
MSAAGENVKIGLTANTIKIIAIIAMTRENKTLKIKMYKKI